MLGRLEWCGKSERSRIALFLKPIQPSRPVDACGFRPIICMSTIKHRDCPSPLASLGEVQKSGSASSDARNRRDWADRSGGERRTGILEKQHVESRRWGTREGAAGAWLPLWVQ